MQAVQVNNQPVRTDTHAPTLDAQPFVDMETIRRRVAAIKNRWSPEMARSRAIEGQRRRESLEDMVLDLLTDVADSEESCDISQHGFNLVG